MFQKCLCHCRDQFHINFNRIRQVLDYKIFNSITKITQVERYHYIGSPHSSSEPLISDSIDIDDSCQCPLCDKILSTKYKVKAHIKRVHHGEKPFKCPKCDKRFAQRHHFKDHLSRSEMRGYCPGRWRNSNKF